MAQLRKIDLALTSFNRRNSRKTSIVQMAGELGAAWIDDDIRLVRDWIFVAVGQLELEPMIFVEEFGRVGNERDPGIPSDRYLGSARWRVPITMKFVVPREARTSPEVCAP
jgi:hypothetical protein